jgi:hypothetical protein
LMTGLGALLLVGGGGLVAATRALRRT